MVCLDVCIVRPATVSGLSGVSCVAYNGSADLEVGGPARDGQA